MLLVPTSVRPSAIHGLGLFAEAPIARGTTVWVYEPALDRIIPEDELALYPPHVVDYLETYCEHFPELRLLVLSGDNDRFTNHADAPNTEVVMPNGPEARVVAARDIAAGEEITCDYAVIRCRKHAAPALAAE